MLTATQNSTKMKSAKFLFVLLFSFLSVAAASGDSEAVILQRMLERVPQVEGLKQAGLAGEAHTGYLVARERLNPRQQSVLDAENADRRRAYELTAQRTGSTAEEVGRQRALILASEARPGTWLQAPNGSWSQKAESN